jgi:hypothetical protein
VRIGEQEPGGEHEVSFTTIPAVARAKDEKVVKAAHVDAVTESSCKALLTNKLGQRDRCQQLLSGDDELPPPQSLPEQRARHQTDAEHLLSCVRDSDWPKDPLNDPNPYRWIGQNCDAADQDCMALSKNDEFQQTLVCLAWAASIYQGHKHEGWNFGIAANLAGERLATYSAWKYPVGSIATTSH